MITPSAHPPLQRLGLQLLMGEFELRKLDGGMQLLTEEMQHARHQMSFWMAHGQQAWRTMEEWLIDLEAQIAVVVDLVYMTHPEGCRG